MTEQLNSEIENIYLSTKVMKNDHKTLETLLIKYVTLEGMFKNLRAHKIYVLLITKYDPNIYRDVEHDP